MPVNRDALWSSGQDESVEVNQRALIDKILARYSGEFTVFRELLQNSDDAQSTMVEIRFVSSKAQEISEAQLPDLNTVLTEQWIFKNNGMVFREEDWHRLKKIAEGNPDEEKIGAFGVGFYSLFSVTEEPFVQSGNEWMGFYWKDNKDQLFARRGKLPHAGDEWTTFEMNLREEGVIPSIYDLSKFLASSLTFMNFLAEVSVYLDDKCLTRLTKSAPNAPTIEVIPRGMRTSSTGGIMTIKEVKRRPLHIKGQVMKWILQSSTVKAPAHKAPVAPQAATFFGKIFSSFSAPPPPPVVKEMKSDNLLAIQQTGVDLTVFSAEVTTRLDKKLTADLQRSTKKNPPGKLKYELVYTGKDEYDTSKLAEECDASIFEGLRANLNGSGTSRIFIGHATGQTTGIGGHMAARFIPTVERESIDLVDKSVAIWNQELLYVGGFLARLGYELELSSIQSLWLKNSVAGRDAEQKQLIQRAVHVMQFFTFHQSTPLDKVGLYLQRGFFASGLKMPFPIITTRGVSSISDARLPDPSLSAFLTELPVIPAEVMISAKSLVETLTYGNLPDGQKGLLRITFEDALKELRSRPLTVAESVTCLKWWITSSAELLGNDRLTAHKQLMDALIILLPGEKSTDKVVPASTIKTFVDAKRLPLDGPLPAHVLPHVISRNFSHSALISSFQWSELSLLQWVQHVCDPQVRNSADFDLEISVVWTEQVLTTLSRNWTSVSAEMRGKIVQLLRPLRCIPTSSGLRTPDEVYFPGANIFPDLPVLTMPSGAVVKGQLERTLEGLGVRRDVELQVLFNKMIKTNEWTISDLLKHLATRNLQPDELLRLQMTPAFPKENAINPATGKSQRCMAKDLYEPLDTFRRLGLPILEWGGKTKWRSSSGEAKLAFNLGLQKYPPIDILVNLCASADTNIQSAAWQYLVDNVTTKYPDFEPDKYKQIAFIPTIREGTKVLAMHPDVFSNTEWSAFGFLVTHPSITKDTCAKLHILLNPAPSKMTSFLLTHQPRDNAQAKAWFEIMSSHMRDYNQSHFTALAKAQFVPTQPDGAKTISWIAPGQCYFRRSSTVGSYSKLFTFVDFGASANSFLAACGTQQEPSPDEVARRLLEDPQQFYDTIGGVVNYLAELQRIAVGQQQLSNDTRQRMKHARFLVASRRTPRKKTEKEKVDNFEDDEWDTEHALKTPAEVVIADDLNAHQLFGEKLFVAPQEDILEAFYLALGSRKLTSLVMERCKFTSEILQSKVAAETRHLVLERLPLFLHEHTHAKTKISFNWLGSKDHFVVKTFGKLTVTKSLTVGQAHLEHALDASAFSPPFDGHSVKLYLAGNAQLDMYEIAMSLVRQLFESPKANDALLFMTILSTDLRALKRRGYNVERILKQQQAERQAAEVTRAKAAEEACKQPVQPIARIARENGSSLIPSDAFHPPASTVKNAFQNIKDKFGKLPLVPAGGSSVPESSSAVEKPHPQPPPVPKETRPTNTKIGESSRSAISSNIDMAINACRPEKHHLLHNREEMSIVKESLNEGYCDLAGHAGSLKKVATMHNVHVYLPQATQLPDINSFLSTNRDSIARFVHVMTSLSHIYSLPMENMHIFHESEGTTIAFNRNGSIFLNLRYYISWHDGEVEKGNLHPALISWYFTLAHEIAHNLVRPHNSEHEFYLSAICEKHLMDLGDVLYRV